MIGLLELVMTIPPMVPVAIFAGVGLLWILARDGGGAEPHGMHDVISMKLDQDPILAVVLNGRMWWDPSVMFSEYQKAMDTRDAYYRKLGEYWHEGSGVEDWRLAEIAVEFGIEPQLAFDDAVKKGFFLKGA